MGKNIIWLKLKTKMSRFPNKFCTYNFSWNVNKLSFSQTHVLTLLSTFYSYIYLKFSSFCSADSCLGGLVLMMLTRNARDWGSIPCWDTEFFGLLEPTVTFGGQLWDSSTCLYGQSMRTCFPQRGVNVMADSCLDGLVGYDTRLECERPGFDPPLRHCIFRLVGTHRYIVLRRVCEKNTKRWRYCTTLKIMWRSHFGREVFSLEFPASIFPYMDVRYT